MNGAFYIAATGLDAQERALDVVANNIANINTTGFKRSQVQFLQLVTGADVAPVSGGLAKSGRFNRSAGELHRGAPIVANPEEGVSELLGVKLGPTQSDFSQGMLNQTGKALDVAISGEGFFELAAPGGQSMLWRGGSLMVNADGYLAASNGMPLKSMISVPVGATSLTVGADGKVQAVLSGSTSATVIGQIRLVQDKDPTTLTAVSGGLYTAGSESDLVSATPGNDGLGVLVPGSLEASNVDLATEMVSLMLMQRAYSANAQVVQAGDQLMSIANELRR